MDGTEKCRPLLMATTDNKESIQNPMITCIKCLLRQGATLVSPYITSEWMCIYSPNEWTVGREGTPLFVYSLIYHAEGMARDSRLQPIEVWEGPGEEPMHIRWASLALAPPLDSDLKKFWDGAELLRGVPPDEFAGCLLVRRFMPVTRVL